MKRIPFHPNLDLNWGETTELRKGQGGGGGAGGRSGERSRRHREARRRRAQYFNQGRAGIKHIRNNMELFAKRATCHRERLKDRHLASAASSISAAQRAIIVKPSLPGVARTKALAIPHG